MKQTRISDDDISDANNIVAKLNEKTNQELLDLDCLIFSGSMLKFNKNSNKLDKSLVGLLELEGMTDINTVILSHLQSVQLMRLCGFALNQKWELIYRASNDGFEAEKFHSKCNSKPNTFVVIKATSGK